LEGPYVQNGDYPEIRKLFDDYLRMYSSRDDSLTERFSENFTGFTGGGDFLVKDRQQWVSITRQDFSQVKDPIRIALKDVAIQSIADDVAVATGFFNITSGRSCTAASPFLILSSARERFTPFRNS
jgi:hypothetical protein